jgi:hypothetical protein
MKKFLFFSLILLNSLISKSLGATNNSLEKTYKILERKAPEKHFTFNKENLLEIFDLEPSNTNVELEIPYFNKKEIFELERFDVYHRYSLTYTNEGQYFGTKKDNGVSYKINDLNGKNYGTLIIYNNEARLNLNYNGKNIKVNNLYNSNEINIKGFDISKTKLKKDYKNIKDLIVNFDKNEGLNLNKGKKFLTQSDSLNAIHVKEEINKYIKNQEKNEKQTFKPFNEDEIIKSNESSSAMAPAPPPPIAYLNSCQVINVNYVIGYDTYLRWQKPKLTNIGGTLYQLDTAIKTSFDSAACQSVRRRLTDYLIDVANIFENEGIRIVVGVIEINTKPWTHPDVYKQNYAGYGTELHANQFFSVTRQWKWGSDHGADGNFKDTPVFRGKNGAGHYEPNAYGWYQTSDEEKIWGLYGLVSEVMAGGVTDRPSNGLTKLHIESRNRFNVAPNGDTLAFPFAANPGIHFYIGDLMCSEPNNDPTNSPEYSWDKKASIIRYTGENNYKWMITPHPNTLENVAFPGYQRINNYLPMLSNPQDGSSPYYLQKPNGCHLKNIGGTTPVLSTPSLIYGYENNAESNFNRIGFIPMLGTREFHTYDYDYYGGNLRVTDTSKTKWNLKDHDELYGEPDEYGDTDYAPFDIDKWNEWMLIYNIATALGARYFKTKDNPNTILAPLARNLNYNSDNYDLNNGTPHISNAFPSESYELQYDSFFEYWWKNFVRSSIIKAGIALALGLSQPTGMYWYMNVPKPLNQQAGNFAQKAYSPTNTGTTSSATSAFKVFVKAVVVAALVFVAIALISFLATGFSYDFSLDEATMGTNPEYPFVYESYDLKQLDQTLVGQEQWEEEKYGVNNWDVRYSWLDLNLRQSTTTPVDLVSFSKGFDKKTGDLIRLNLTNDYVTGVGFGASILENQHDVLRGEFVGRPRPYAKILIQNLYRVTGDSLRVPLTDSINIMKRNTLPAAIADAFTEPDLLNYYGKGMKPYRDSALYRLSENEFGPTEFLNFSWRYNNNNLPSTTLNPRVLLSNTDTNNFKIIALSLRTTTDRTLCQSNLATKYIRVYPRKFTPITETFSSWYTSSVYGLKNWEFIGPWSVGEGSSEASLFPTIPGQLGFYNRGSKPWNPKYLSNTGWTKWKNTNYLTYTALNTFAITNNPGPQYDLTQKFKGEADNTSPKSPVKNWYNRESVVGDINSLLATGTRESYWECDWKSKYSIRSKQWFIDRGYHYVTSSEAALNPLKYDKGDGYYRCTLYKGTGVNLSSTISTDGNQVIYPETCSLGYWRQGTSDTARSPVYSNSFKIDNKLSFTFKYAHLFVDTAVAMDIPNWPNPANSNYSLVGQVTPDSLEVWGNFSVGDGNTVIKQLLWKRGGRGLNTVNLTNCVRTGNPAQPSFGAYYKNAYGASWQPRYNYAGVSKGFQTRLDPFPPSVSGTEEWGDVIINLNNFDFADKIQFDFVYKNKPGIWKSAGTNLFIAGLGLTSGTPTNLPLTLCAGGNPSLQWETDTLQIRPDNMTGRWYLYAPEVNNATRYKVWRVNNFPQTKTLIDEGEVRADLSLPKSLIFDNTGAASYSPVGTQGLVASGTIQTESGNAYTIVAALFNTDTVTLGNNRIKVTNVDSVLTDETSVYQMRVKMKKPLFGFDSTYNTDNINRASIQWPGSIYSTNLEPILVENVTLQRLKTAGIPGEVQAVWENVGPVKSYINQSTYNWYYFNTQGQIVFQNWFPTHTWDVNNVVNGVNKYRVRLFNPLSRPKYEYSDTITVTTCLRCPGMKKPQLYVNSPENPILNSGSTDNKGVFYLYTNLINKHNIKTLYLIEEKNNIRTIIKQRNLTDLVNSAVFIDTLNKTSLGIAKYAYQVEGFNPDVNPQVGKVYSNAIKASIIPPSCSPLSVNTYYDRYIKFDLNPSKCKDLKYKVFMYKLNNRLTGGFSLYASDSTLTDVEIGLLPESTTPVSQFNSANGNITLTAQEISTNTFYRLMTKPSLLNSWYKIDVICTSCLHNNNKISTYYYFKENDDTQ